MHPGEDRNTGSNYLVAIAIIAFRSSYENEDAAGRKKVVLVTLRHVAARRIFLLESWSHGFL